jgi:hypothetical protein
MTYAFRKPTEIALKLRALSYPERFDRALEELFQDLGHQDTIWEPTPAAAPFVVELALRRDVSLKEYLWLLVLVWHLASVTPSFDPSPSWASVETQQVWVDETRATIRARLPELRRRLANEENAEIRLALAALLAPFPEESDASLPLIREARAAESDERRQLLLDVAVACLAPLSDIERLIARLPNDYYDADVIEEAIRDPLARGEDPRNVFREVLSSILGHGFDSL